MPCFWKKKKKTKEFTKRLRPPKAKWTRDRYLGSKKFKDQNARSLKRGGLKHIVPAGKGSGSDNIPHQPVRGITWLPS